MSAARILVVEDEAIVAEDLRDLLEGLRYEVAAVVPSGREAIAKAVELRPDLVLMDIRLKGAMEGIEAAVKIREQTGPPVVFLTAYADERTMERAKTACPYGYLTKPFDQRTLRATIEVALNRVRRDGPRSERDSKNEDEHIRGIHKREGVTGGRTIRLACFRVTKSIQAHGCLFLRTPRRARASIAPSCYCQPDEQHNPRHSAHHPAEDPPGKSFPCPSQRGPRTREEST